MLMTQLVEIGQGQNDRRSREKWPSIRLGKSQAPEAAEAVRLGKTTAVAETVEMDRATFCGHSQRSLRRVVQVQSVRRAHARGTRGVAGLRR